MFKADMHMHTTCSDGTFTPSEILHLAKAAGLTALSITDHDTVNAYTPELFREAEELGLELCTGIELSCRHADRSVHLLGYAFDIHSEPLLKLCKRHQKRREERNRLILAKLKKKGMPIEEEELKGRSGADQTIGRPHIAQLMMEKGYVSSIRDAFNRFIGDDKPCYDEGDTFTLVEGIDVIHQAGGKAFIAHPHLLKEHRLEKEVLKLEWDGIECYYAQFSLKDCGHWLHVAQEKGLLVSGGSDFHGAVKEGSRIASSWIDENLFRRIVK